jgi:hypothetical protein
MKWLKSTCALMAVVGATAVSGSTFAYHRHWQHSHHGPDVSLGFSFGVPLYAPAPRYYYEPGPAYYYSTPPRYYYYGRGPYYYYGHPDYMQPGYDPRFPPALS